MLRRSHCLGIGAELLRQTFFGAVNTCLNGRARHAKLEGNFGEAVPALMPSPDFAITGVLALFVQPSAVAGFLAVVLAVIHRNSPILFYFNAFRVL